MEISSPEAAQYHFLGTNAISSVIAIVFRARTRPPPGEMDAHEVTVPHCDAGKVLQDNSSRLLHV